MVLQKRTEIVLRAARHRGEGGSNTIRCELVAQRRSKVRSKVGTGTFIYLPILPSTATPFIFRFGLGCHFERTLPESCCLSTLLCCCKFMRFFEGSRAFRATGHEDAGLYDKN